MGRGHSFFLCKSACYSMKWWIQTLSLANAHWKGLLKPDQGHSKPVVFFWWLAVPRLCSFHLMTCPSLGAPWHLASISYPSHGTSCHLKLAMTLSRWFYFYSSCTSEKTEVKGSQSWGSKKLMGPGSKPRALGPQSPNTLLTHLVPALKSYPSGVGVGPPRATFHAPFQPTFRENLHSSKMKSSFICLLCSQVQPRGHNLTVWMEGPAASGIVKQWTDGCPFWSVTVLWPQFRRPHHIHCWYVFLFVCLFSLQRLTCWVFS